MIFLLESNLHVPDIGDWVLPAVTTPDFDFFHVHGTKAMTWTFADGHARAMRMARTIYPRQMWTDQDADQAFIANEFEQGAGKNPRY